MSWLQSPNGEQADVEKALRAPIGAVSPLWWAFAATAGAGVAYWWMTRWARPINLEAGFGAAPVIAPVADPVLIEAAETYEMAPEAIADVIDTPAGEETQAELAADAQALAAEAEEKTASVVEALADDLTKLVGIGPKLAVALAERGVTKFVQIAGWDDGDLSRFDAELSLKGRAVRDAWVAQARRFAEAPPAPLPE
jgi:predicted flap endonuclease-1-like 5' DNA nuclease